MKATRPVFLNLWRIKFPMPAIVSILHRTSGVIIFLGLPFLLYLLNQSLISQESFDHLSKQMTSPVMKLLLWIIFSAVIGHFLAGIRHIVMDTGFGESLRGGRISAYLVFILTLIIMIGLGIWIWS